MEIDKNKIIAKIAKEQNINLEKINESSRFKEDLGADSIDLVELLIELEEEMDIVISEEEAIQFKTIGDLFEYLEKV